MKEPQIIYHGWTPGHPRKKLEFPLTIEDVRAIRTPHMQAVYSKLIEAEKISLDALDAHDMDTYWLFGELARILGDELRVLACLEYAGRFELHVPTVTQIEVAA